MAYNATQIKQKIGKAAFDQTFQYFNQLPSSDVPATKLDRLNLFLTKLKEYSGIDVIALFTAQGKAVYEAGFGGTVGYILDNNLSESEIEYLADYHRSMDADLYNFSTDMSKKIPLYDNATVCSHYLIGIKIRARQMKPVYILSSLS